MARIFISYARDDGSSIAHELANRLRALNHEVFLDIQGLPGGSEWEKQLIERGQWCDVLLLLVTDVSNQSKYVYNEFREAEKNKKLIIPIRIGETNLLPHYSHLNVLPFNEDNYDGLLLKLEVAMRELPSREPPSSASQPWRMIGAVVAIILAIGVVAIIVLGNEPPEPPTSTQTAIASGGDATEEVIDAETPIDTPVPPTATNTDTPTATDTDIPTATDTPIPPTATKTDTPTPTDTPFYHDLEIPQDRILYAEDFEDGRANGWLSEGLWQIVEDNDDNDNQVYRVKALSWNQSYVSLSSWQNYGVRLRFKPISIGSSQTTNLSIFFNAKNDNGWLIGHSLGFFTDRDNVGNHLGAASRASWEELSPFFYGDNKNDWNILIIESQDNSIRVTLNDRLVVDVLDDHFDSGTIAIAVQDAEIIFDDIVVWSLDGND